MDNNNKDRTLAYRLGRALAWIILICLAVCVCAIILAVTVKTLVALIMWII